MFYTSQKRTSIKISYFLNRTISHSLSISPVSVLSTSQILKSQVVFKSQCPLICGSFVQCVQVTRVLRTRSRISFGFLVVTCNEYSRRISREDRNPHSSGLNDEQLFSVSSLRVYSNNKRTNLTLLFSNIL